MRIHINPHVLEWNRMEFSLILLQSTSTHVHPNKALGGLNSDERGVAQVLLVIL